MAAKSLLLKYTDALRANAIPGFTKKSRDWFVDLLMSGDLKGSGGRLMKDAVTRSKTRPIIGRMYIFVYDPKYKATLPYYDRYPLIIACDRPKKGKGFYGLNLHYLAPYARAKLMNALMTKVVGDKSNLKDNAKIRIDYAILKGAQKYRAYKPCFKRYLPKHIKGHLVEIPGPYWEVAMFLPTQKFRGASVNRVWRDSLRLARKK